MRPSNELDQEIERAVDEEGGREIAAACIAEALSFSRSLTMKLINLVIKKGVWVYRCECACDCVCVC